MTMLMSVSKAKGKTLLMLVFLLVALSGFAREYKLTNIKVIDGDTIKADIHLGFSIVLQKQSIRLSGIDTPETRTRNVQEKEAGLLVKKWLIMQVENGKNFKLLTSSKERGKFGRPLGVLCIDDINICAVILSKKYALYYIGKTKVKWLNSQLKYIIKTLKKEIQE